MYNFNEYAFYRLVEDEMYTDKDVISFMPGDAKAQMAQITDKVAYMNIIAQVKQALNQAYQAYVNRQGPSPNVDAVWRSVIGGGQPAAPTPQLKVARALGPVQGQTGGGLESVPAGRRVPSHLVNQIPSGDIAPSWYTATKYYKGKDGKIYKK